MKVCGRCGEEKDFSNFNKKGSGYQPYCRPCDNLHAKEYYQRNKEKIKSQIYASRKIRVDKLKDEVRKLKQETPCSDCGIRYPYYVMDFDHLEDKEYNVSHLLQFASKNLVEKEIKKCEIVCSNCHRERTHKRNSGV